MSNGPDRLTIVRHGQSEWNYKRGLLYRGEGGFDPEDIHKEDGDYSLTEVGIQQAVAAGPFIRDFEVEYDRFLTSGLSRAQDTAYNLAIAPQQSWEQYDDLNERDWGKQARQITIEEQAEPPQWFLDLDENDPHSRPPEGESKHDGLARYRRVAKAVIEQAHGQKILMVIHGEQILNAIAHHEDLTEEEWLNLEWRFENLQTVDYSKTNPETGQTSDRLAFRRIVSPLNPDKINTGWQSI